MSDVISWIALVVAVLSAAWTWWQGDTARKALKLQEKAEARMVAMDKREAVKLSVTWDGERKRIQVRNDGHSPIWLVNISITHIQLSWSNIILQEHLESGSETSFAVSDFAPKSGDTVVVEYRTIQWDHASKAEWTSKLP